jgi:hypothetical protein
MDSRALVDGSDRSHGRSATWQGALPGKERYLAMYDDQSDELEPDEEFRQQ